MEAEYIKPMLHTGLLVKTGNKEIDLCNLEICYLKDKMALLEFNRPEPEIKELTKTYEFSKSELST